MPFGQKQAKKARISMNFTAVGHDTIDVKKEPYDFTEIISANFKIIYEKNL